MTRPAGGERLAHFLKIGVATAAVVAWLYVTLLMWRAFIRWAGCP